MSEGNMQPVVRCEQCNKPFDKQSTLKRHGYYCRSRTAAKITRSRSCISCARSKVRCDNKQPKCSRCNNKNVECHFPADRSTPKRTVPRSQQEDHATTERRRGASSLIVDAPRVDVPNRHEASNDSRIDADNSLAVSDVDFTFGGDYFAWDDSNMDIDFANLLNQETSDESVQYPSSGSSSIVRYSNPPTDQRAQTPDLHLSIPPVPTSIIRTLIQRPRARTGTQTISNLMLHNLKSFPLMMLRHNTLPPFIHPHLISSDVEDNHMEPLTNCINLVHMISSGAQGSRKLFWRNVRLECERMCEEHPRLNRWELLAAMQALSIYILIRLEEGQTDHNNFDFLLLTTVTVIGKQLNRRLACKEQSALYNYGIGTSWKDWLYEESRRRLVVVYRVVDMLVYFEPAAICELQKDLVLAPLPAKKQLWEAADGLAWKAASEREFGVQADFGLAANGELVKFDIDQPYCSNSVLLYRTLDARSQAKSAENWEEWCSGMDGLGGLVMLAASLTG